MPLVKPQHGVTIDWANPLTKGLRVAILPERRTEYVERKPVTVNGVVPVVASSRGGGISSTAVGRYVTAKHPILTYTAMSWFLHCDFESQSAYPAFTLFLGDETERDAIRVTNDANKSSWDMLSPSSNVSKRIMGSTLGDASFLSPCFGKPSGLTLTWDSKSDGLGRAYVDGKLVVVGSTANYTTSNHSDYTSQIRIGLTEGYYSGSSHVTNAAYQWSRKLSEAEIAELNYDPWVIFKTPRKAFVFLFGAGGGGGIDTITGTADQTFANFVSSATANEIWQGSSSSTLANFTSSASASEIYQSSASQTMGAFVGSTTATHSLPTFTASAAQSFANFISSVSAATDAVTFTASAAQTLANFTSAVSASEIYQSSASQTLANFTSAATATRSIPTVTGTAAQTLENFTSEAYVSFGTTTLYASASQTMGAFVSSGSGKIGNTATANQTISDFVSLADVQEAFAIAGAQSFGNFTSTATATSGQVGIAGSSASLMGEFVSTATALQKYQAVAPSQMGNFVSDAQVKQRYIASASQSFGNFNSTANVLTGDHPIGHFIYVRNIGVINAKPRRV